MIVAQSSGQLAYRVKSAYAAGMRSAGRGLVGLGVIPADPPAITHRTQHWVRSLFDVHDSLAIAKLGVPWWTYSAIEKVDALLAVRRAAGDPIRAFEYGSGASTLWLAQRCDEVITVEHHRGFAEHIRPELMRHPNIRLEIVEPVPSAHPVVPSSKSGSRGLDFADYVSTIDRVGGRFDLVVVDGRARPACLAAAVPHLAPDGFVVFDNTRRRRYRAGIAGSGLVELRLAGLTPTLPYPDQTSLLARPAPGAD